MGNREWLIANGEGIVLRNPVLPKLPGFWDTTRLREYLNFVETQKREALRVKRSNLAFWNVVSC
jgi:hypothetical protein